MLLPGSVLQGLLVFLPSPGWSFSWLELAKVLGVLSQKPWIQMCNCCILSRKTHCFLVVIHHPWLSLLSTLFSAMTLKYKWKDCDAKVSFRAKHTTVDYSVYSDNLLVSVLITIYWKKKQYLWWTLCFVTDFWSQQHSESNTPEREPTTDSSPSWINGYYWNHFYNLGGYLQYLKSLRQLQHQSLPQPEWQLAKIGTLYSLEAAYQVGNCPRQTA